MLFAFWRKDVQTRRVLGYDCSHDGALTQHHVMVFLQLVRLGLRDVIDLGALWHVPNGSKEEQVCPTYNAVFKPTDNPTQQPG